MSDQDTVITVRDLSKCYRVFASQRARLAHAIWPRTGAGMREVWALRDVGFEIKRGESVAIIGRNGGGKSTLLEILTGTLTPTSGEVHVNGRVSALLELGSGFNPTYTGRENVLLNGLLLGLERTQILARFNEIEAFAEIGEAIDRPVKTYSTGMMMRLAFAVQILLDPQILIVDEALGVGDFFFQQKCYARLRELRERGLTLLFVSHDMGTVRDLCQRALYLKDGRPAFFGDVGTAIRLHMNEGRPTAVSDRPAIGDLAEVFAGLAENAVWSRPPGSTERLLAVHLLDAEDRPIDRPRLGSTLRIRVFFRTLPGDEALWLSLAIKNRYDQIVSSTSSARLISDPIVDDGRPYFTFEFELDLMLEGGQYALRINIGHQLEANRGEQRDSTDWFGPLAIQWDYENETAPFLGMFGLPARGRLIAP